MKRAAFALVMALAGTAAFATEVPNGSRYDGRIQYVNYNAGDVVLVRALPGLGARIVFGEDEQILDMASGFTQGWELKDRRNILFLKPKSVPTAARTDPATGQQIPASSVEPTPGKWDTNLMVTTNKHMYDFDLKLLAKSTSDVAFRVQFFYPAEQRAKAQSEAEKKRAEAKLDVQPAPMNWRYSMQIGEDSQGIAPAAAYDDGRFTYLRFPANRDFPSAFLVNADKSESLIDHHIDPAHSDVLVLHRVAKQFVLRLGNGVVGVYNEAYDPDGVPPVDGTTVPGVRRVIKTTANSEATK